MAYDEKKFESFNQMLRESRQRGAAVVMVQDPQTLGDDYQELVENLNRLADAELTLSIVPRRERG